MRHFYSWMVVLGVGFSLCSSSFAAPRAASAQKDALMIELTGKDPSKIDDVTLYGELVKAYRSNDEIGFKSRLQTFMTRFASSSYADNALYLAGRMAFQNKNYGEAIRYYQQVITKYPRSNKVVGAKLAKGIAYKQMNLQPQARTVFVDLRKRFPGSPEAFRAENEMKLIK